MKGISYVTDEHNKRIAVQIDLKKYGELWEDFYDNLIAESRKGEEKIPLNQVIDSLKKSGRLDERRLEKIIDEGEDNIANNRVISHDKVRAHFEQRMNG